MIIIMHPGADADQIIAVEDHLKELGFGVHRSEGEDQTVVGAVGSASKDVDPRDLELLSGVREVHVVKRAFQLVDRVCHPQGTVVDVAGVRLGGDELLVMAGPCAIESEDQINRCAASVSAAGATMLRGGAFKPRSSPYSFQGLGEEGLRLMRQAADTYGLACVTEVMDASELELVQQYADMVQVGARNMQNYRLLSALGACTKPVLLKRGLSATLEELLLSAEYIVAAGNPRVVLCERGVRTFEPWTRNTLDLSAIPILRKKTHLPIVIDPSHATGIRYSVAPMARAALAAGADGLMVEVHPEPERAWSDGAQSLRFSQFDELMADLRIIAPSVRRRVPNRSRKAYRRLDQPVFDTAVIIGVGLMGGSLALALREAGAAGRVLGVDVDESLDAIRVSGVVDELFPIGELAAAVKGADLVVLAAPVRAVLGLLESIGGALSKGCLVTDLGSTKLEICQAAQHHLPDTVYFIGGHPMAGAEQRGAGAADALMFLDAAWALCPADGTAAKDESAKALERLVSAVGANPLWLEPERHDKLAAAVSHVPHLVSVSLANAVGRLGSVDELAPRLAAGGFRDVTRTASSPSDQWCDILATNRQGISDRLAAFREALQKIEDSLAEDGPGLEAELVEAARHRLNVPRDLPGMSSLESELIVRVVDQPGVLAAITTALAREEINIRDIQVLKVRRDEDGVLRLAFADKTAALQAAEVLRRAGHHVRLRAEEREAGSS